MAAVKTTLAALVAKMFGNSEQAISEKLSSEEYNQFTTDAQAAAQRITELEGQVSGFEETVSGLTTRAEAAENALTEKTNRITELEGSLTEAETDRDKYKGWFEEKKAAGKGLPAEDASNRSSEPEALSDYNADALAYFRKEKGGN
ncbi:hypothetical protein [Spirosoma sp.]|uniref:hypothetical protein n=1 Tax=Spirosoma sp. TaxID=1899569 RepID=UPI0026380EC2|nr:hypothetical protein [Spirosoma sp.]MCX6216558.1 hypothetical protein [Spirosoma sp.]